MTDSPKIYENKIDRFDWLIGKLMDCVWVYQGNITLRCFSVALHRRICRDLGQRQEAKNWQEEINWCKLSYLSWYLKSIIGVWDLVNKIESQLLLMKNKIFRIVVKNQDTSNWSGVKRFTYYIKWLLDSGGGNGYWQFRMSMCRRRSLAWESDLICTTGCNSIGTIY